MSPSSRAFELLLTEATSLHERNCKVFQGMNQDIGVRAGPDDPNYSMKAVAKLFLNDALKLTTSILLSINTADRVMDVNSIRPLLVMMVNARFIYNHPKHQDDANHMRSVCDDLIRRSDIKKSSTISNRYIFERAGPVGLLSLLDAEEAKHLLWSNFMLNASTNLDRTRIESMIMDFLQTTFFYLYDISRSISVGMKLSLDKKWVSDITAFAADKMQSQ